ncbi:MAG TPA: surface lipoprotein assembly modifier [Pyrinomonadaceae bacterium]|nr:surface lipoprotein assembly modifier [Pyrinomonadaceae bacterium]
MKTLAVALACAALAAFATAVTAASGGHESQSNANSNRGAQGRTTSSDRNANGAEKEEREDRSTHATQDEGPGRSAPARGRPSADESRYHFEMGVMPRYISNYFQTQDDFNAGGTVTPIKSVYVTTVSGNFEYDLMRKDRERLTAGLRARRNFFKDLPGADSTDVDVWLDYDFQPNRLRFGYFGTPRRLISVFSGRNIYGQTNGFTAEYQRRLSRTWRARGSYVFSRQTFSEFNERDLSIHQVNGDVRYRVSRYFSPGAGFEYQRGNAESENFSYTRPALVLLATSDVKGVAYMSFRYRFSKRDYITADTTSSNFGREETRHDVSFYSTVKLGGGFSLFGFYYHTDNNSNLASRSFNSYETGLGLFYRFPR